MDEILEIVKQSMKGLAGLDASQVLVGFDKKDIKFGYSIASQNTWTVKQTLHGCKLVIKYKDQLPDVDVDKVTELMNKLEGVIEQETKEKENQMKVFLLTDRDGNKKLAIICPYDKSTVDKIKTFEGRRWNQQQMRWELPMANLQKLRQTFPTAEFSEGIKEIESIHEQKSKFISEEFKKIASEIDLTKPLPDGKIPFTHQRTGILRMVKYLRQILADDMGLGKTFQALVASKILSQHYGWLIIVIAPVSLLEKPWTRDAVSLKIPRLKFSVHSWAKIPNPPQAKYILIADEAHYAQAGEKTIRGKAFLKLAEHDNCMACYPLTGTPIKNGRPINLFPLLRAVKHELSKDSHYFQLRYCDAHSKKIKARGGKKRSIWDVTGTSYLEELHLKIKDVMIRRTKKECLDLPEKLRVLREAELSREAIDLYNSTLASMRQKYQERLLSGEIKAGGEELVMLGHLAHAGALGKVETAYELASEILEEGNQAVIFCTFREPLEQLKARFQKDSVATELLIGDTKDRERLVDNFLKGKSRVFLLSMAGGVGIDLYSASEIILINRPWTPGDTAQIEDRLHRIGQKNAVTATWLQYGEVDKHVDGILESKSMNISQVLQSKNQEDDIITFAKKFLKAN